MASPGHNEVKWYSEADIIYQRYNCRYCIVINVAIMLEIQFNWVYEVETVQMINPTVCS